MKNHTLNQERKPYTIMTDDSGRKWVCDLGVNDQGYLSAQHCWEVDSDIAKRIMK